MDGVLRGIGFLLTLIFIFILSMVIVNSFIATQDSELIDCMQQCHKSLYYAEFKAECTNNCIEKLAVCRDLND